MAKNLSFHEAAKMLQTTNVKLLEFLRNEKIMFRSNRTNLPYQKYINWFFIKAVVLDNTDNEIIVPIIRIKPEGFKNIEAIYKEKTINQFKSRLISRIEEKYKKLGFRRNILKEMLKWNKETGKHEIFYHDGNQFHKIFEYNIKTLTINELQ